MASIDPATLLNAGVDYAVNVFLLDLTDFDPTVAQTVTFWADGCTGLSGTCGGDNDYVVSAASVPIPAALPLFATALAGLGIFGWRKRKAGTA